MTETIDMSKTYTTRNGMPVRILCVDKPGEMPVVALVDRGGVESIETYTARGKWLTDDANAYAFDLIEVKPVSVKWLNVYANGGYALHSSREVADQGAKGVTSGERTECIRIEYTEGQLDD